VLYGVSLAMMLLSTLGLAPWDVLHSGIIEYVPLTIGQAVVVMSFVVLVLWIPLREKPGVGTISNAIVVGLSADATLAVVPEPSGIPVQVALLLGGVFLNGVATGMYIGSQLGRGPRDGLMTGLARRTGWSLRLVRTGLEITVVAIGWLLGGVVGIGTVLYALAIGPVAQWALPLFIVPVAAPAGTAGPGRPGDPGDPPTG